MCFHGQICLLQERATLYCTDSSGQQFHTMTITIKDEKQSKNKPKREPFKGIRTQMLGCSLLFEAANLSLNTYIQRESFSCICVPCKLLNFLRATHQNATTCVLEPNSWHSFIHSYWRIKPSVSEVAKGQSNFSAFTRAVRNKWMW